MTADLDHVTNADRIRWLRRSLDRQDAQIEELTAVLNLFVKQWNACGPNSEFGKYFSNVRNAAVAILQRDESPEPMHVWSND